MMNVVVKDKGKAQLHNLKLFNCTGELQRGSWTWNHSPGYGKMTVIIVIRMTDLAFTYTVTPEVSVQE